MREPNVAADGLSWEYSRNQRRHTAYDRTGEERFWIVSEAPFSSIQGKHGYRLKYPDGSHIRLARTVKILKEAADNLARKNSGTVHVGVSCEVCQGRYDVRDGKCGKCRRAIERIKTTLVSEAWLAASKKLATIESTPTLMWRQSPRRSTPRLTKLRNNHGKSNTQRGRSGLSRLVRC